LFLILIKEKGLTIELERYLGYFNEMIKVGWPQSVYNVETYGNNPPVVFDIDQDNKKEIILALGKVGNSEGEILIFEPNGSYSSFSSERHLFLNPPSVYSDGGDSIISIGTLRADMNFPNELGYHYLFNTDGTIRNSYQFSADLVPPTIIGDVNNDGFSEVISVSSDPWVNEDRLYVFREDGSLFSDNYPIELPAGAGISLTGTFVLADLNGDGKNDILGVKYTPRVSGGPDPEYWQGVIVYDFNGSLIKEWPIIPQLGLIPLTGPVTVTDLEGDGFSEVVVLSQLNFFAEGGNYGTNRGVRLDVFTLGGEYDTLYTDWPMYRHDPQHTGCYDCF